MSVLLGAGDGTFAAPQTYEVDRDLGGSLVQIADINVDGVLDIATASRQKHSVSVLPGVGDGTFGDFVSFTAGGYPLGFTVADMNSDGAADLVMANFTSLGLGKVSVLLNLLFE